MPTCKIIPIPILPSNAFRNYSLITHSFHTRTNLISTPAHAPTSTPPTVRHRAPATQPSQGQPKSCRPLCPNHAAQPPRSRRPTAFLFLLFSSSTLRLPLAQCHRSGHHQPPAHFTSPLNPPNLAVTILHPLRSLSFPIYLSFPQFLTLSCSFSHRYIMYML